MIKIASICGLSLMLLTGCNPSTTEVSNDFIIPPGLYDCKFYDMKREGSGSAYLVVRCPNSDVSTSMNKSCGKGCSRKEQVFTSEGNEIRDSPDL